MAANYRLGDAHGLAGPFFAVEGMRQDDLHTVAGRC
jgi:hypothetical protein